MARTDEEIRKDIIEELEWEPEVPNAAAVGVAVEDGVVTLTGCVAGYLEKLAAEKAAKRVSGVQAVAQNIEVKLPESDERSDADVARAVRNALDLNFSIQADSIGVRVEHGWVTLDGEVDHFYQRSEAERVANRVQGVTGLTNLIQLEECVAPTDVKDQIQKALERMASVDANKITVETVDGKIILRGTVRSWAEKEEAERAARTAPGVREVEDRITISW